MPTSFALIFQIWFCFIMSKNVRANPFGPTLPMSGVFDKGKASIFVLVSSRRINDHILDILGDFLDFS